jgi:hypothetical protein
MPLWYQVPVIRIGWPIGVFPKTHLCTYELNNSTTGSTVDHYSTLELKLRYTVVQSSSILQYWSTFY